MSIEILTAEANDMNAALGVFVVCCRTCKERNGLFLVYSGVSNSGTHS